MRAHITAGPEAVTLRMSGDDDLRGDRAKFEGDSVGLAELAGGDGDEPVKTLGIRRGWNVYIGIKGVGALTRALGGRSWIVVGMGPGPAVSQYHQGLRVVANQNPSRFLFYAGAATAEQRLGSKRIRGAETTGYRGSIEIDSLGHGAPQPDRPGLKRDAEGFDETQDEASLPIEVWIDDDQVIHRLVVDYTTKAEGVEMKTQLTADFSRFGVRVDAPLPRGGAVTARELERISER